MSFPAAAVLFDLDGTLVNTIPLIFTCYRHTLATHLPGYDPGHDLLVENLGRSLNDILFDYAVGGGAADPEATSREMLQTYRAFQRENLARLIQPFDGMREALAAFRERGVALGVVTSKVEWAARECLEFYGLLEFLTMRVFHDDTERHKPDPQPLLVGASQGGFDPARCVYVGDSVQDMIAGKAAGMFAAGALWGPSTREKLEAAGADVVLAHPLDLLAVVA